MTAEETFVPTRGAGFVPNRLNLVMDLKDAYAGIGLVPAVTPYPDPKTFQRVDVTRFLQVQFQTIRDARRSSRAYEHSTQPGFGERGWREQRTGKRRVTLAIPLADVPELIRCLQVERKRPVEASRWERFIEAVAR